ncbi:MAG: biotin/lipoyl-binding protein, partial [Bilophila sp.]
MSTPKKNEITTIETNVLAPNEQHPEAAVGKKEKKSTKNGIEDPRRIIRQGLVVIILFFGILGVWATFSQISGAVVGQGKVKIETERKTVQHLEGGIVESILVREGDTVQTGQPLVILESIQVDASVDMLRKQLAASLAGQARYTAEKDLKDTIVWPEELSGLVKQTNSDDLLTNEQKIFSSRRDALDGQVSLLQSQIGQMRSQISGYQEQLNAEQAIIGTLEEELKAKRQLYAERYLEKSQILELERQLASHQGNRGRLRQSIAEAHQKSSELRLRIEDTKNRFVEDASNQL